MNLHPLNHRALSLVAAASLAVAPALVRAQVSLYQYSESVGTYTEVTAAQAAYSLGVPAYWPPTYNQRAWVNNPFVDPAGQSGVSYLNPAIGPGYPIGFNFTFNGEVFDVLSVSNSGFITFGKSNDGISAVWTYAIDHPHGMPFVQYIGGPPVPYQRNRVAGWGNGSLQMQDLSSLDPPGPVSSIRVATLGTAPNRTCVVQFKDFRGSYSASSTLINFQIRLNEADNSVEVKFGQVVFGFQSGGDVQVGLGGSIPEDFNSRMTAYEQPAFLYDWNITVPGVLNTDACNATEELFSHPNGSGVPPVMGRTFKWTPDPCPPPAFPLTIANLSFDYASAQWQATAAGEYEYFVSTANSVTGPEVLSGTTTDPQADLFGLQPATTYYVFVRSICNGQPGTWSLGTPFLTYGGGVVVCDGGVMEETYCSHQNDVIHWLYTSADASPLRIEFLDGFVGNNSLKAWDGTGPSGMPLTMSGDIDGNALNALSGSIYIELTTDVGSCETQPWYLPVHWRVGCKNCTDPLVNFTLGTVDCDNQQFNVDVNVFAMGSSSTLSLENDLGLPATVVSTTGIHSVGPFPAGQSVIITAQNPDNAMCYAAGSPIINDPCAITDCGPTTYTYCYGDNEQHQWAYQGAGGQEIGIRFIEGSMGLGDALTIYNGLDILNLNPAQTINWGGLANTLLTSAAPSTDHALVMSLVADNAMSCQDADPLYGTSQPWKYVVACYDGCTQPQASFTTNCLSTTTFEVQVNVSQLGSTGSVNITNTSGAPAVTASSTGTYTVGPFQSGVPVTINVEGASVLCTWTSPVLAPDCSTSGLEETGSRPFSLFPNPSNGLFQLVLPGGEGIVQVQVMDLTGRTVAEQSVNGSNGTLHLEHLPNGFYTVVAQGDRLRYTSKISIQY
jgi:hypothetical protein